MDALTRIMVVARPGHYRDSLIALLRTIPTVILFVQDGHLQEMDRFQGSQSPDIVVVDPHGLSSPIPYIISPLREKWPAARFVVLMDSLRKTPVEQTLGIDYTLSKITSAGELTSIVNRLCAKERPPGGVRSAYLSTSPIACD